MNNSKSSFIPGRVTVCRISRYLLGKKEYIFCFIIPSSLFVRASAALSWFSLWAPFSLNYYFVFGLWILLIQKKKDILSNFRLYFTWSFKDENSVHFAIEVFVENFYRKVIWMLSFLSQCSRNFILFSPVKSPSNRLLLYLCLFYCAYLS